MGLGPMAAPWRTAHHAHGSGAGRSGSCRCRAPAC
jgi:hypothetical protein